jgi:hypothetical protein
MYNESHDVDNYYRKENEKDIRCRRMGLIIQEIIEWPREDIITLIYELQEILEK